MMLSVLILLCVSYAVYLYFGAKANPFVKPRMPLRRRRWRLGRQCALAVLLLGLIVLFGGASELISGLPLVLLLIVVAAGILGPAVYRYVKSGPWVADHQ